MQNFEIVEIAETIKYLYKDGPNLFFRKELFFGFLLDYLLIEVSVVKKLHNNTKVKKSVPEIFPLKENFFVGDNAIVFDGG